ncbi:FtsX-like permease family protein [Cytobacillus purgationiresistens]|uniref:Bacitracin transport system permease protein n=1 Tax=Cytobacillus purgationiresistens TaxID=863449 RepID=A0ABU0AKL5_9BACI|nr:FtsX-like permease family protein [Cytobacillus purgationiresistens]MDQ0271266.1 bacitracin transport system permease protein [Cytobacillus purgationiresistens]
MTVFELALRSMRQNVKHYYLYFFALIFSMSLYFVFTSLQHDQAVQNMTHPSVDFFAGFQIGGVILIVIVGIFTISANGIFLRRRSREIGLYQLIGLSKGWVARYLMIENILLGLGALLAAIICGALISRLFVLFLLNLLGLEGIVDISFSVPAAFKTLMVYLLIIVITSIQMMLKVYRSTLLNLFQADKRPDLTKPPKAVASAIFALLGLVLIGYGYELSGHINKQLFLNALLMLGSIVAGTYLLFRVTIRWCFYRFRKRKDGHLGLTNSLSMAPLMHHTKANANSLTLITLLSAMTITMISMAYSFYYSVEQETRRDLPYDFMFENEPQEALSFKKELEKEGIDVKHHVVEAVLTMGIILDPNDESRKFEESLLWLPAEQLKQTGADLNIPPDGEAILYNAGASLAGDLDEQSKRYPTEIELEQHGQTVMYTLRTLMERNIMNLNAPGTQLLVSEATMDKIAEQMAGTPDYKKIRFETYQVPDKEELAIASSLYNAKYVSDERLTYDFYTQYKVVLQTTGLLIFIAAFLGLVFLISTGSILYFKQMTEAEQEKQSFKTLRQLGFDVDMIMKGIIRKQAIVFLLPLSIGMLHSIFAIEAASFMIRSDTTFPASIAMAIYTVIYLVFALFTIGYYRNIVKKAMS